MESIADIIELISYDNNIDKNNVKEIIKNSLIKVAKKYLKEDINYDVSIDDDLKQIALFRTLKICSEDDESLKDTDNFISLSQAKKEGEDIQVGDELRYKIELKDLGKDEDLSRSAVNMFYQEVTSKIQSSIEEGIFNEFKPKVDKIIAGKVIRIDNNGNTYIDVGNVQAIMRKRNRIKGEIFKTNDSVCGILKYLNIDDFGIHIEISRTTPLFLKELLTNEVPEIKEGEVSIQKVARIPGDRAKVALISYNPKVDPIGAAVGSKGVRINAVSQELNNESIDCIEYSEVPEIFVSRALLPATISSVIIEENKAQVTILSSEKPKAIGKKGTNIRLASMITGFEIEVVEIAPQNPNDDNNAKQDETQELDSLKSLFKK